MEKLAVFSLAYPIRDSTRQTERLMLSPDLSFRGNQGLKLLLSASAPWPLLNFLNNRAAPVVKRKIEYLGSKKRVL